MLENTNVPIMQKAVRVIYDMSEDTRVREMARMREKALHDEATYLKEAMEKGLAQGRAEGRAEGRVEGIAEGMEKGEAIGLVKGRNEGRAERDDEIIARMKAIGYSDDDIKGIFGL